MAIEKKPFAGIKRIAKARLAKQLQGQKLSENFYVLRHFKDGARRILDLCFDFNNIHSLEINLINKWRRTCRLDSPYVEEMLQKYEECVFRIGTLPINRPL